MLIVDGVKYKPWTPKDEEREFHPLVKAQSKEIFGKDTVYFDVKTLIKTASGIGSIPDAYVIDLAEPFEWYVIENELATHPVYDHVVRQLTKFINGIENKDTKNQILDMLYEQINKDNGLRTAISTKTGNAEIYHFLSKLILTKKPRIVVIIDEITLELEEASHALSYTPDLVEFRTYVREDNPKSYAHLFKPLNREKESFEQPKEPHKQNWEFMLEKLDAPTRKATVSLMTRIVGLNNVVYRGKTSYSAYIKQIRGKYGFVGLVPHTSELRIRIRSDPTIIDPKGWINPKPVRWFTGKEIKQEREFKIKDESQVDYAFELVKQSYEIIKKREFNENKT
jgi:hypothetical protein